MEGMVLQKSDAEDREMEQIGQWRPDLPPNTPMLRVLSKQGVVGWNAGLDLPCSGLFLHCRRCDPGYWTWVALSTQCVESVRSGLNLLCLGYIHPGARAKEQRNLQSAAEI